MNNKALSFAEVIESSLNECKAQSWKWNTFPEFGSLVTITTKKRTLFGIVCQLQTGSMEAGRFPFAYQKTEEELLREQPQIFEFLKTIFTCVLIGYKEHDTITQHTPPEPPQIHAFINYATPQDYKLFFASHYYLNLLFHNKNIINIDELIIALINHIQKHKVLEKEHLITFIENFSLLTGNDYRRLKLLLQKIPHL